MVHLSACNRYAVSGSDDKTAILWDMHTGMNIQHTSFILFLSFFLHAGGMVRCLRNHEERVNCVQFSPDCKYIASGSDDKTAKLWDVTSGNHLG